METLGTAPPAADATVAVATALPTVRADRAQIERVFQNLIGNAIKYRAADRPMHITVGAAPAVPGFAAFAVTDNGIGIATEDFDRIFQIFTRLHGRTEYEGTGIGLAVVKRIVERHGGAITLRSEPGVGSTFVFSMPLAEPAVSHDGTGADRVPA